MKIAIRRYSILLALVLLQACATRPDADGRDPFESLNRTVFMFNEGVDAALLKPTAKVYQEVLPSTVRTGVSNFFANISDVWSFINSVLQLKPKEAAENLMRVGVNTLFGVGGLFDVATDLNIERHKEDFGQTLGRWGVGAGPYVVLPFFGPSTARDTLALAADRQGDGVNHITPVVERNALSVLRLVDTRANLLPLTDMLEEIALDKYDLVRDVYLQRRRYLIDGDQNQEPVAPKKLSPGAQAEFDPELTPLLVGQAQ